MKPATTGLLVSVRSADEARIALEGGATLIDVKEPSRGALGQADDNVIADIVREVNGRRPVSAAMGELADDRGCEIPAGLAYVKWGLAGCAQRDDWQAMWKLAASKLPHGIQPVVVAYADCDIALAPPVQDVVNFACQLPNAILLIDTFQKGSDGERKSLLDWQSVAELQSICTRCHVAGGRIALAGSLTMEHALVIRELGPDWMAVRGAVCGKQERGNAVELERVRELAMKLGALEVVGQTDAVSQKSNLGSIEIVIARRYQLGA